MDRTTEHTERNALGERLSAGRTLSFSVHSVDSVVSKILLTLVFASSLNLLAGTTNQTAAAPASKTAYPTYQTRTIEGWTVHISDELLEKQTRDISRATNLLQKHLQGITNVVPAKALAFLRTVPLWLSAEYPGQRIRAEYHPSGQWLEEHGRNPVMAKCVEMTNIRYFEQETRRMPVFVLHELAHAYHDQVLGNRHPEIRAAYQRALESKSYDAVKKNNGKTERAYALNNPQEYFAESTEAFFGENDFYPFNRAELQKHDPEMFQLLVRLWGVNTNAANKTIATKPSAGLPVHSIPSHGATP